MKLTNTDTFNHLLRNFKMKTPVVFTFHINWNMYENFNTQQYKHIKNYFLSNNIENVEFIPILTDSCTDLENRIRQFKKGIERISDKYERKCHVVAYSFAGILPRGCIGLFNGDYYIKTLLTISTPHKGSQFVNNLISRDFSLNWFQIEPVLRGVGVHKDWLSREYSSKTMFDNNSIFLDSDKVGYYSVGGRRDKLKCSESLRFIHENLANNNSIDTSNDGLILPKESEYGKHLINYDADHFELIEMRPGFDAAQLFGMYSDTLKNNDDEFLNWIKTKESSAKLNIKI